VSGWHHHRNRSPENFSKIVPGVEPGKAEAILRTIQSNKNSPAIPTHVGRTLKSNDLSSGYRIKSRLFEFAFFLQIAGARAKRQLSPERRAKLLAVGSNWGW